MTVQEVVLHIEDRPGELARIFSHLYDNDVRVLAFWVGPDSEKAALRFVANDPDSAVSVLTGLNLNASLSHVLAAKIPDHPGGLISLLKILQAASIDIRHTYYSLHAQDPVLVLDVDNPEEAARALQDNWITLIKDHF
jgi:hypothetical protein